MTELLVQTYLRSGKTLDDLKSEHGVKSNVINNKVGLNYDQIEASESDPLASQCRGLVLRLGTFDIVACPLFRFFNHGQASAAEIDWKTAAYEEKLDGTNIIVYFDSELNKWCCGTRGRAEADAPAHDSNKTFAELVDETANLCKIHVGSIANLQSLMKDLPQNYTYIFELCTPINRIICKYNDFSLHFLGCRNNITLQEESPLKFIDILKINFRIELPKLYYFSNTDEMIKVIRDWNPELHEGVVVKDKDFNRIKVKNPQYVAYNHLLDSLSTSFRGCMEVILLGTDDDVIHMMPDYIANRIKALKPVVQRIFKEVNSDYERLKNIEDMKEFALEAKKCIWTAPLFALKRNKIKSIDEFIFNKSTGSNIQQNTIDGMLDLCRKIEPSLNNLL